MGSDVEDDEKSNEEMVTKQNAMDGNNKSSAEVKKDTEKTSDGESGKKRKRAKRSSSDSQKSVVDANSLNADAEEASETSSNNGTLQKRKRKSKISSESEEPEEKAENNSTQMKMPVSSENKMSVREDVVATWKRASVGDPKERRPMLTDPALPHGWRRECVQRKTGKTGGLYDVYIFNPEGKKFRSRVELARFLVSINSDLDPEDFDFSVYGRKGYASNSAIKKKIKSILEMHSSVTTPKKDMETKSVTPKPDKQSDSGEAKRTSVKAGRKSKDKTTPTQPQKKARFKFTPTIKEIFKCASENSFCLECGKTDCKYPYVVLEHPPRPLDLLVKEGIKYR